MAPILISCLERSPRTNAGSYPALKMIIACLAVSITFAATAQPTDSTLTTFRNNSFHILSKSSNHQLIVFLHGGIHNPYFKQAPSQISLPYLVENNSSFLEQALENGFDLILPISNDSLNWLEEPEGTFTFLQDLMASRSKTYQEIYIGGFSDGGTGSFKIFYSHPQYFQGLMVFNGYPQHANFSAKLDYSSVTGKKILFFSTYKDKVIPYEFILVEYCHQKEYNANTYFYLSKGGHGFNNYDAKDLGEVFAILTNKAINTGNEPIQGYLRNDELVVLYPFRKKIVEEYNFGQEIYEANVLQNKELKPRLK